MSIPIYQIDAFTSRPFGGNPAAVCPLDAWLPDATLQAIALENNLSETAFFVPAGPDYHLRWFTPTVEVNLCGHATLATASLILERLQPQRPGVVFETRSGTLTVRRQEDGRLAMDFPSWPVGDKAELDAGMRAAMGGEPLATYHISEQHGAPYYLMQFASEADVAALRPNFPELTGNVIATAEADADDVDFVSRFFAPKSGIDEDPVTGSAHCTLAPFWAERLGKTVMEARQISARGGEIQVALDGDRVRIVGACAFYMEGSIDIGG